MEYQTDSIRKSIITVLGSRKIYRKTQAQESLFYEIEGFLETCRSIKKFRQRRIVVNFAEIFEIAFSSPPPR